MTGTAMLIFACGFFIYAVSPSYASYNGSSPSNNDYALVPVNKDGSINIKISEEQLEQLSSKPVSNMNKIGDAWYIGCGSGIWYTESTSPYRAYKWTKVE